MKFLKDIDYKLFDLSDDNSLVFFPQDPSLFRIKPIIKDILLIEEKSISGLKNKYSADAINEALKELETVKNRGFLNNRATKKYWNSFKGIKQDEIFPTSMTLHVAQDCNMVCSYCFAEGGSFGKEIKEKRMSWDIARRSIDWFMAKHKNKEEPVSIGFFGGEPLLNKEVIEKALKHTRENYSNEQYPAIRLLFTTNGTLFTEDFIRILYEYKCSFTVSLDAYQETHDRCRKYKDGRGTFDEIMKNISKVKEIAPELPFTVLATLKQDDDIDQYFKIHNALGVAQLAFNIEYSLFATEKNKNKAHDVLGDIKNVLTSHLKESMDSDVYLSCHLESYLAYLFHSGRMAYETCGAGLQRMGVATNGDIYMCSRIFGDFNYMGTVFSGIIEQGFKKALDFNSKIDRYKEACNECWARSYCYGLCVYADSSKNGRPSIKEGEKISCDMIRFLIEYGFKFYTKMDMAKVISIVRKGIIDARKREEIARKVELLYHVRDMRNSSMKHIQHVTPTIYRS